MRSQRRRISFVLITIEVSRSVPLNQRVAYLLLRSLRLYDHLPQPRTTPLTSTISIMNPNHIATYPDTTRSNCLFCCLVRLLVDLLFSPPHFELPSYFRGPTPQIELPPYTYRVDDFEPAIRVQNGFLHVPVSGDEYGRWAVAGRISRPLL